MDNIKKKKVLVPIFNRAHYGRLRSVLKAINEHPELELQIIVSSSIAYDSFLTNIRHSRPHSWRNALPWYIRVRLLSLLSKFNPERIIQSDFLMRKITEDGFIIAKRVPMFVDGGSSSSMTKAVGFGLLRLADDLKELQPDIVFVHADRFEMMAVALAAAYLNIPIAHNEGGDISGTIDESIRHSITKLAHIHFTATPASRNRVLQMGENPDNVFNVGSPAIDIVSSLDLGAVPDIFPDFDYNKKYLLVMFHPVTTEDAETNLSLARNIISVVEDLAMPTVFLGSNVDAKSKEVGIEFKKLLAKNLPFIKMTKHLPPDDFYKILARADCALGNSSSFIREGAYFGTPAVLVGSRQQGRDKGRNIKEVGLSQEEIKRAVLSQLEHGRYESDPMFGIGGTGEKMANILAKINPDIQKRFFEL